MLTWSRVCGCSGQEEGVLRIGASSFQEPGPVCTYSIELKSPRVVAGQSGTEGCTPGARIATVPMGGRWMLEDGQEMTGCPKDLVSISTRGR